MLKRPLFLGVGHKMMGGRGQRKVRHPEEKQEVCACPCPVLFLIYLIQRDWRPP